MRKILWGCKSKGRGRCLISCLGCDLGRRDSECFVVWNLLMIHYLHIHSIIKFVILSLESTISFLFIIDLFIISFCYLDGMPYLVQEVHQQIILRKHSLNFRILLQSLYSFFKLVTINHHTLQLLQFLKTLVYLITQTWRTNNSNFRDARSRVSWICEVIESFSKRLIVIESSYLDVH